MRSAGRYSRAEGYNARGEYLVWAGISAQAIISYLSMEEILQNLPSIPGDSDPFRIEVMRFYKSCGGAKNKIKRHPLALNYDTGKAVGEFLHLLQVPIELLAEGIDAIVFEWGFDGFKMWVSNEEFLKGVCKGFGIDAKAISQTLDPAEPRLLADIRAKIEEYDDFPGTVVGDILQAETNDAVGRLAEQPLRLLSDLEIKVENSENIAEEEGALGSEWEGFPDSRPEEYRDDAIMEDLELFL